MNSFRWHWNTAEVHVFEWVCDHQKFSGSRGQTVRQIRNRKNKDSQLLHYLVMLHETILQMLVKWQIFIQSFLIIFPWNQKTVCAFYIQSFQDWICWPRGSPVCASVCVCVCVCVCLSVCVSVCLSRPLISTILGRFWWNLDHMILTKIWDDTFLKFWNFWFDDVITAFLYVFQCGTLTSSIFA